MSRMMGRPRRIREGRGIGEILSEGLVYILIVGALIGGGVWYKVVYLATPGVALSGYLTAVNKGDIKSQYWYLSASTKKLTGDIDQYESQFKMSHGLVARVPSFAVTELKVSGDQAELEARLDVRRTGQELYQATADSFTDRYLLRRETEGWKVVLEKSVLKSMKAAEAR